MKRAALLIALLPGAALAHHGWSEYDSTSTLKITGRIAESGYEHPHGHVRMENGQKMLSVILAPPSRMERRGLTRELLKPGTTVTVEGYANKNRPEELRAERILVNGKTIELR